MAILGGRFRFPDNDRLGHLHVGMLLLGFLYRNGQSLAEETQNRDQDGPASGGAGRVPTCSWSTSSSPVMMILFSMRVSEYPPFTVCNT